MSRFDAYTTAPGFELVIAYTDDGEAAGPGMGVAARRGVQVVGRACRRPEPGFHPGRRHEDLRTVGDHGPAPLHRPGDRPRPA